MILKDTNEIFADDLRDPAYAAGYLNIALEDDGVEGFLYALQKVARAHGISKVATSSDLPRESLYRALSDKGNPGIKPLTRVLNSLGLCLTVSPSGIETYLNTEEGVADTLAASDPPMAATDVPMPQEQSVLEISALQRSAEQTFAMLGDMARQLAAMQEEARMERMEARQAATALQNEALRSHARLQHLAAVMEDQVRRNLERGERTTLSGTQPAAIYSFPTRTGKRRIEEEMFQPNPLRLVKGVA